MIEGFENDRFAIYIKFHHSQVDSVGGIRYLQRVFSSDPNARDLPPPWSVPIGGGDAATKQRGPRSNPLDGLLGKIGKQLLPVSKMAGILGAMAREGVQPANPNVAVPFQTPMSILNGRIRAPRRFSTQHYELARIRKIADTAGVSINDVFLALCAGALRRYLQEIDQLPEQSLTASLPVSVRHKGDESAGNAISFILAKLATDEKDPAARLQAIHRSASYAK